MKLLLPAFALIVAFGAAAPAAAQPLDIIVRGGAVVPDTTPRDFPDRRIVRTPITPGGNFDPAQASLNALAVSNFYPAPGYVEINFDRAFTLNATGDSILEHQLKCQAAYASYDPASDTFIGANGIPQPCRL